MTSGRKLNIHKRKKVLYPVTLKSLEDAVLCVTIRPKHSRLSEIIAYIQTLQPDNFRIIESVNAKAYKNKENDIVDALIKDHAKDVKLSYNVKIDLDSIVTKPRCDKKTFLVAQKITSGLKTDQEISDKIYDHILKNVKYTLAPLGVIDDLTKYLHEHKTDKPDIKDRLSGYFGYLKRKLIHNAKTGWSKIEEDKVRLTFDRKISSLLNDFIKEKYNPKNKLRTVSYKFLNYVSDNWNLFFKLIWDVRKMYNYNYHTKNGGYCDQMAQFYSDMANSLGLRTAKIIGYSPVSEHAWNAVKINGNWRYIDLSGKRKHVKESGYTIPIEFKPKNADVIEAVVYTKKELNKLREYGIIKKDI